MLKPTKHNLKKLELLLGEGGYSIRYEKGNFQSGYCIVKDKKVVIVNKFYDAEARFNALFDIITTVEIQEALLSDKSKKVYELIATESEE